MFKASDQLWSSCKITAWTRARQLISCRKIVGSINRIPTLSIGFVKKSVGMKKILQRLDISHRCRSEENHAIPLRTALPEGPRGILLFGFSKPEEENISNWLSVAGISVVSGKVSSNSTVADALDLLQGTQKDDEMHGQSLTVFSRVVLFSGFSGEEIEGLIEIWNHDICKGIVSFGYVSRRILQKQIDKVLIEIIRASDENDISNGDQLDAASKQQLQASLENVVKMKIKKGKHKGFGN
eukprot:jgi/Picsp_1/1726/NSC_05199-R1_---NA---